MALSPDARRLHTELNTHILKDHLPVRLFIEPTDRTEDSKLTLQQYEAMNGKRKRRVLSATSGFSLENL